MFTLYNSTCYAPTAAMKTDATWSHNDVEAAISRDLLGKAQRWKRLAK